MDFSRLYFRNAASFKSLALIESIAAAAKIFEFTATLNDDSILLVSNFDGIPQLLANREDDSTFQELLACGTKPIDALAFLLVNKMEDGDDKIELMGKFKYNRAGGYIKGKFEHSCAAVSAAYVIAVTRGSLPGSSIISGRNPIPNFVRGMFVDPPKNESELAEMLMSFDPKHINLHNLFVESSLVGWPEEVANRLNLGVAGHKTMKACMMLLPNVTEAKGQAKAIVDLLAQLGFAANGGFYPNLHPANNTLKTTYPKFYTQTLRALFDCLKGTKEAKYELLERVGAFKSDALVTKKTLEKTSQDYLTWNVDALGGLIGKPVKFSSYDYVGLKRKEMVKLSDFNLIEPAPVAAVDKSKVAEIVSAEQLAGDAKLKETEEGEDLGSTKPGEGAAATAGASEKPKKGGKQSWTTAGRTTTENK